VIDLHKVDWAVLDPVWERPIVMHNAAFDLGYLAQRGIEPVGVDCTMQAVRLLNGPNASSLETAATSYFGLALDKALQVSDWVRSISPRAGYLCGRRRGCDLAPAETVLPLLGDRRSAYNIQVGAIPAAVRMQLRGILLDEEAHAALITALKTERVRLPASAERCEEAGRDLRCRVPDSAPPSRHCSPDCWRSRRSRLGHERRRASQHPRAPSPRARSPIHCSALVDIGRMRSSSTYGGAPAARISPVTGRIHAFLQNRRRDLRPQHLQQAEHAEHPDDQPVEGLPSFRTLFGARTATASLRPTGPRWSCGRPRTSQGRRP
jgi:hypothetical protein